MPAEKHVSSTARDATCDLGHRPVIEKRRTIQARSVWLLSSTPSPSPTPTQQNHTKQQRSRCADAHKQIEARRTAKGGQHVQKYSDPNGWFGTGRQSRAVWHCFWQGDQGENHCPDGCGAVPRFYVQDAGRGRYAGTISQAHA